MIGLQHQRLTARDRVHPAIADMAQIRRHRAAKAAAFKGKAHRLIGVVRNREGVHVHRSDVEILAGIERAHAAQRNA